MQERKNAISENAPVANSKTTERKQSGNTRTRRDGFTNSCEDVSNSIKFNDDKPGYGTSSVCGIGQTEAEIQGCEDATNPTKSELQNRGGTPVVRSEKEPKSKRPSCNQRIWEFEPNVGRVANGIPGRVDRLKGLGNAIVPQVAYELFKAILEHEQNYLNEDYYE